MSYQLMVSLQLPFFNGLTFDIQKTVDQQPTEKKTDWSLDQDTITACAARASDRLMTGSFEGGW